MPQFPATIRNIQEGVKGFTISAATKNIEGWETTLQDMDTPGVKAILRDLGKLKAALREEEIDGEEVKALVVKLGRGTAGLAKHAEGDKADKVTQLGEALSKAAEAA